MYYVLSIVIGIIIAVMVSVNGQLTMEYGLYLATVMIHITGIITVFVAMILRKEKFRFSRKLHWFIYTGGALGVVTTLFNNLAFGKISVSAILALSLFGQSLTSIVIDQFGLFHMEKRTFCKLKWVGIFLVIIGIAYMTVPIKIDAFIPIIVSFVTGLTIVVSRTTNAVIAKKSGALSSSMLNYLLGFVVSFMVLIFAGSLPHLGQVCLSPRIFIYLGGMLGAIAVILSNLTVAKISSFYMTLFLFVGQTSTGIILDFMITKKLDIHILMGAIFVSLGLCFNLYLDNRKTKITQ